MYHQNNILIVGPAWVGDTVMAQALFKLLKQQDARCRIDVLAPAWTFSLLKCMPEIRQAIEMPITHGELKLHTRYQIAQSLKANQYDQAIILPNSFKAALIPWFLKIPKRTGWLGEWRYGLLNDIRYLDKKRYPLMVEQFMALALPAQSPLSVPYPYPALQVSHASQTAALAKQQILLSAKPVLVLCAGAEFGPAKRWPTEYFAQVAEQQLNAGWDVWLLGSHRDRPITDKIMQLTANRCFNLSGYLDLSETTALLSLASGVVTNDSGLMHIAAALQKPLVALYGATSPGFTPPLADTATILKLSLDCQPCFKRACPLIHHRCLRDLTPERVLKAIASWGL